MHEFSIVLAIFRLIEGKIEEMGAKDGKVRRVSLLVGKLTSVVPEALLYSFEMASAGTIFEGGKLEIVEVPVSGECASCGREFSLNEPVFLCPHCESPEIRLTGGRELFVESFDLEDSQNGL